MEIKTYLAENQNRILDELFELLRIPSISAISSYKSEMFRCAEGLKTSLLAAGADKVEVCETEGNPVVFGEKFISKNLPTILVYGHYDVMPVEPLDLWNSPPFEPQIRDGKIFARGADDDKGQLFIHIKAFEFLCKTNTLNCNIKFMFEGEEEVGSTSLEKFCAENREKLHSDFILVSDTSMLSKEVPSLTAGLRGLCYMEVEVTGPNRDLHSGHFGGAVANPINILAKMISQLHNSDNKIAIPHFYDDVIELSQEERNEMAKAPFDIEKYKNSLSVNEIWGEKNYSTLERVGIRPCLDVNGIWGGYIGEGTKTVLPSKAFAKISMRLVPNQNPDVIAQLFEKYFVSLAPQSVKVQVKYSHGGNAYSTPIQMSAYQAASLAVEKTFGKKPVPYKSGGSIPIIATFEKVLGTKTILMGFGLDTDAIHSPNENFPVETFFKGIETIVLFHQYLKEV